MHVDPTNVVWKYALTTCRVTALLFGLCLVPVGAGSALATMPSAPLEMAVEATGTVAVDADLVVTLTVRPLVDTERLSLQITLPEGVDLVAGETSWIGPVRAQEGRVLTVTVRPRRAVFSVIQGAARIEFPDGTMLGDLRSLPLALGERSKPTFGLSPSKKTATGESVIEFRDAP